MTLREATSKYIKTKIKMTKCQQKHMRQLCHLCLFYSHCKIYSSYVRAWIKLQKTYNKGRKNESFKSKRNHKQKQKTR